ncbi:hypothetical protein LAZ67_7001698 [Cordylochernes scorpioides]|uniref:Mos1 transposase HTH domain-containing protein n=1 Tax=Cordylochernes scorpioides TaxID=51811 RepID=A0ABY6KMK7_9ARAC|nr:hypothetical protein LAZ67_7001698 [Cordylochernes scorpioides]
MLTIQQKENRIEVAKKMLEMLEENPNWKEKVITGDETWVYGHDQETKHQSMEWKGKDEPRTKKSRLCMSKNKVLLVTFFDIKGIVHYEYLEEGQTINKESYLNMRRLRESIYLKKSEMWSSKNWIIHHDPPPHTATSVLTYLAKHGIQILQQPPFSPDLAPNDFFLFPKLKMALKGRRFDTRESIIADSKKCQIVCACDSGFHPLEGPQSKVFALCYHPKSSNLLVSSGWDGFLRVFWIVFDFYLLKKMDQRTCIKFCVKNEIKCADAFRMLTVAYGEATLDRSNVYRWYKMFSEGREDVNNEERAGCPSTSTTDEKINEVEKMILANRRITVREFVRT